MANDPSFPPALKDLAKSGIGVAAAPTGGMGLGLTEAGKIPGGVLFLGSTPRQIAYGNVQMTFPGGTSVGNVVSAAHGLGVVPVTFVALAGITSPGGFAVAAYANGSDATNITIGGYAQGGAPPGGNFSTIYWLAIG